MKLNLPELPSELEYLLAPAQTYGNRFQSDSDIARFLECASESDMEMLATIAERVWLNNHYPSLVEWWSGVDTAIKSEVARQYPPRVVSRKSGISENCHNLEGKLIEEANRRCGHMDLYFLFGLMDACDLRFE